MISLIILIFGTVILLLFSWYFSIKAHRYHGVYRFFSLESILCLVIFNSEYWFLLPFALHQVISWIVLTLSFLLAIHGFYLLKQFGKPEGQIENTSILVVNGAYGYIRHPLYCSLLLGGLGVMLKHISSESIILTLLNIIALFETAKLEEKEMLTKFGSEYKEYMNKTKMFIPYIF